jgi:hypothetical protein
MVHPARDDFDPWEFFENVAVNAKKKKRSRCRFCGEQWWDIGTPVVHLQVQVIATGSAHGL